jgi:hypothetical protein
VKSATDSIVENAMDTESKPIFLAKLKKRLRKAEEKSEKDGGLLRVIAGARLLLQDHEDDCIGCPISGIAQRAMREVAPPARGVSKARQL